MPKIYSDLVNQLSNVVVIDMWCLCDSLGSILDYVFYSSFAKDQFITVNVFCSLLPLRRELLCCPWVDG